MSVEAAPGRPRGAATGLALGLAFSLVWSSAFVVGKIALRGFDPATTLALRFALSAAALAPSALTRREAAASAMGRGLALGVLNNAAYLGLTFWALAYTRPVTVIVVVSLAPFLTMGLAATAGVERVRPRDWLGALVAFAGVVVITGVALGREDALGVALAFAGTLAFSAGSILYRARGTGAPIQLLNFWQSLAGAMALAPAAFVFGRGLSGATPASLAAILYLAFGVTVGGMALWMALIRRNGAGAASSYHLMNPVFGALLSTLILGAPFSSRDFLGAAIIGFGLWLGLTRAR